MNNPYTCKLFSLKRDSTDDQWIFDFEMNQIFDEDTFNEMVDLETLEWYRRLGATVELTAFDDGTIKLVSTSTDRLKYTVRIIKKMGE